MLKKLLTLGSIGCVLLLASNAHGQALPTATGGGGIQVGGGYTFASPDYAQRKIQGFTLYGDLDLKIHYGLEAEYHYISLGTPTDIGENSFLVGPRFVYPHKRLKVYAKGLLGIGDLVIQNPNDNVGHPGGNQFAYALGAGVDYQITRHIVVRPIDFEYQHWSYQHGLTPMVYTFGVAYRLR
jgi:opacity protein-like surface antigen